MRHIFFGLTVITLFAFGSVAQAESFKRIKSQDGFVSTVVGKKLTGNGGTLRIKKNGTITGRFDKDRLKGEWVWRDGLFCRWVELGKSDRRKACQKIEVTSSQVRFTTTVGNRVSVYSY